MIPTATYPLQHPRPAIGGYRYFFNGQEADNEVLGDGGLHAFGYRMHNARIGRFWSVDPLAGKFPWNSVYALEGREVDTYAGASFGFGLVVAHVTMKTEVTKSFSITYEEQTSLINLVKEKGFEYNNVEPKFEVINHYLYYIDRGDLFNIFKDTPIKTDIKMIEVGKDQWESESYQRQVKEKQSK